VALVPTGPQRIDAPQIAVDEAPPPAKVETIPERPEDDCRWLDGQWEWEAAGWRWRPGSWVVPPKGCYFARSTTAWATGAQGDVLYFRLGRWVPDETGGTCAAPRRCETRTVIVDAP
jgi:hypothetical protein